MDSRDLKMGRDWERWCEERVAHATSPHGPAALVASWWLHETPSEFEGIPGTWQKLGETAVGTKLESVPLSLSGDPVEFREHWQLVEGEALRLGDRLLRIFVREGTVALRLFDPGNLPRQVLHGIEPFPFDSSWVRQGIYRPSAAEESLIVIETVDGKSRASSNSGAVEFQHPDGTELQLVVQESALGLRAVFSDATSDSEAYRFRFLDLPLPNVDGTLTVDLNRAYLPPCAFSDYFACPFPDSRNRLQVNIRAGERALLLSNQKTTTDGLAAAYNESYGSYA